MKQKLKKCCMCPAKFKQSNSFHVTCSPSCAIARVKRDNARADSKQAATDRKKAKVERQLHRAKKEAMKTLTDWLKEAQTECNKYIRLRDANKPCISCGNQAKKENSGHYQSVGSCKELRFHPLNIHLQCEPCNSHLSGNIIEYRKCLIKKIGVGKVEWLENHHDYYAWTIEDAKEIKAHYKELIKTFNGLEAWE